jgi:hypothetical protein
MLQHATQEKAPAAPTVEAQEARIQLDTILPQPARQVNPYACPHCVAVFNELVAARNLITAYEASAERQKGGQR